MSEADNHESLFSDESTAQFVKQLSLAEPRLRAFLYTLLPGTTEVDEVMQEVSVVLWKKFDLYDPNTPFLRWAYVVARYEVMSYRRRMARDRHVFSDELLELMEKEYSEDYKLLERKRDALQGCLSKLPKDKRTLITTYYGANLEVESLAKRISCSVDTLYKRISRIRKALKTCMQGSLA